MIYLTGDTHGEFTRFSKRSLNAKEIEITKEDYVIVCGDFGLCWEKNFTFDHCLDDLAKKPYTILWIQGNHENYDMIAEYPLEDWNGGKVRHILRDKIILLERGQIFEIEGKTFFTFGGASSHDIQGGILERNDPDFFNKKRAAFINNLPYRINHESWWKEELPTDEEMNEGFKNLERYNYKVDYIITHCCSTSLQEKLSDYLDHALSSDVLTDYLEIIENDVQFEHWYFGHYHIDKPIDKKHSLLYHGIIEINAREELNDVPILGKPRYRIGDIVSFTARDGIKEGKVLIVDAYGTFDQNDEPSYDILVESENCLYKHVIESEVKKI